MSSLSVSEDGKISENVPYQQYPLQTVTDTSTSGLLLTDERGHCIFMNATAEKITGYTLSELENQPLHQIVQKTPSGNGFHPDSESAIFRALHSKTKEQGEEIWIHKNGEFYHSSFTASPVIKAGTITGVAVEVKEAGAQGKAGKLPRMETEERFRYLAETLPQLVWITDAGGKQEFASKRWQDYTGIQPADEKTWGAMVHPDDFDNTGKAWSHSLQTGETYKAELRLLHKTGEYRWNHVQGEPVRDDAGNIIKWMGAFTDIHEQKKAEETIRYSEERFRNIANEAPVMLWMTNAAIQSVFFNKSWLDFTGIPLEDQLGKPSPVEVHPDDYEDRMKAFLTAFGTRKKYEHQFRMKRYDGQFRWIKSIGIPRFSAEGVFEGFIGSSIDIHDTVLQQQRKDSFMQMASHELKTPVTTLKAYTQLLLHTQRNSDDNVLITSLEAVDKQAVKINKLIEDILNLTRMERNSLEIDKKAFAINELVRATVAGLQKTFPHHRLIIAEDEPAAVLGDKDRIEQVIINFITNAVKYSPKANKVIIRITAAADAVSVSVEDFGIGIAHKDHDKIFDKFYRVEGKDESTYPGFGIGLYIAREFIKLHGGKIGLSSEQEKGSLFYFTLPRYKAATEPETALIQ